METNNWLKKLQNWINKFKSASREKKFLIIFTILCILMPFTVVRNPTEILTHIFSMWANYYLAIGFWKYSGIEWWRALIAAYGVTSFGIIGFYYGIVGGIQALFRFLLKKLREYLLLLDSQNKIVIFLKKIILKKKPEKPNENQSKSWKVRFIQWLSKQSLWLIIFFIVLPFPYSDPAAAIIMKTKNIKYGIWILLVANFLQTFILVLGIYSGLKFFF